MFCQTLAVAIHMVITNMCASEKGAIPTNTGTWCLCSEVCRGTRDVYKFSLQYNMLLLPPSYTAVFITKNKMYQCSCEGSLVSKIWRYPAHGAGISCQATTLHRHDRKHVTVVGWSFPLAGNSRARIEKVDERDDMTKVLVIAIDVQRDLPYQSRKSCQCLMMAGALRLSLHACDTVGIKYSPTTAFPFFLHHTPLPRGQSGQLNQECLARYAFSKNLREPCPIRFWSAFKRNNPRSMSSTTGRCKI